MRVTVSLKPSLTWCLASPLLLLWTLKVDAAPLAATTQAVRVAATPVFPVGRVVERVTSRANPRQSYAIYLPSGYREDREWPLLVLLDPRGRALLPLERVRQVADRLGYMVVSSYNSRSDEAVDPNADALNAILDDADRMLALDPRRIYLVGQSGTARVSWLFAAGLPGNVAGVIGIGAGFPGDYRPRARAPGEQRGLAFFGAAGTDDYNFDEMWSLDATLDTLNLPHRITWFDGPHTWPPAPVLTEAVEWMELQAMKSGLKPADAVWIASLLQQRLAGAEALERAGDDYLAWRRYREITLDFRGVGDASGAIAAARRLEQREAVRRMDRHLEALVRTQDAFYDRLGTLLGDFRGAKPPTLAQALARLDLDELQRRAANPGDSMAAHAAERSLEQLWVYTSFYEPRDYLARGDATRALAVLDLADRVRPGHPDVCYFRAQALSRLGRKGEALTAVECAAWGGMPPEQLERDPALATLLADAGYRFLLVLSARPGVAFAQ